MSHTKKVLLAILDGWGYSKNEHGNAVSLANTPNIDHLLKKYPHTILQASGKFVGLPDGQMGNSEVGHLNIGAGRIVYTGLSLIDKAISDGSFNKNKEFLAAFNHVKKYHSKLHIMGLVSHGGVHSKYEHIIQLIKLCYLQHVQPILHIFTDGRDTDQHVFVNDLKDLLNVCTIYHVTIGTIAGRYYAMDRDQRWTRSMLAFNNLLCTTKEKFQNLPEYVQKNSNISDEFFIPAYNSSVDPKQIKLSDDDAVIFCNFRPDRARQLCHLIVGSNYYDFKNQTKLKNIYLVSFTKYEGIDNAHVAFDITKLSDTLGEVIADKHLSQLRIAETEKYPHVTFFFDGGKETTYENEQKILVPSPRVATYDLCPEMSAQTITDKLLSTIGKYDLTVLNFANADMVGHTGILDATIKAVECVDKQIGRIYRVAKKKHITMFITADHGNAECMLSDNNRPVTQHTTNPVMLIVTDNKCELADGGKLGNLAPTILDYMHIIIPKKMTELSLLKRK